MVIRPAANMFPSRFPTRMPDELMVKYGKIWENMGKS
jgi:hypothetical protein